MTLHELNKIRAFRGNITIGEAGRINNARIRNRERLKHGITIEPSTNKAIATMIQQYPTHGKD